MTTSEDTVLVHNGNAPTFEQGGYRKDGERIDVSAFISIERLSKVDLVDQTFYCQFTLDLVWRATEDDHRRYREDKFNYRPSFIPEFKFSNGNIQTEKLKKVGGQSFLLFHGGVPDMWGQVFAEKDMRCKYLNQCHYEISGEFSEQFELENFPMDVQDLQIAMTVSQSVESVIITPRQQMENRTLAYLVPRDTSLADYEIHEPIYELWKETVSCDYGNGTVDKHWARITFRMKIVRKWKIYFWRIGLFTMILSFCSMAVFSLDKDDGLSDRYDVLLTLLLAAVAFQYIINSELPKLPYLTLMDIYVLFSFSFVFMVIGCVFTGGVLEVEQVVDDCFFAATGVTFFLFHIWFLFKAYRARQYELAKVAFSRWEYQDNGMGQSESDDVFLLHNEDLRVDSFIQKLILECPWWTENDGWARSD